jgi:hypothetical protein
MNLAGFGCRTQFMHEMDEHVVDKYQFMFMSFTWVFRIKQHSQLDPLPEIELENENATNVKRDLISH